MTWQSALVLSILLPSICDGLPPDTSSRQIPPLSPLPGVEWVCDEMIAAAEPTCELSPETGSLRVWIPGARPQLAINGEEHAPAAAIAVADGWRLHIDLPPTAEEITLLRGASRSLLRIQRRRDPPSRDDRLGAAFSESRWEECIDLAPEVFARAQAEGRLITAMRAAQTGARCGLARGDTQAGAQWLDRLEALQPSPGVGERLRDDLELVDLIHRGAYYSAAVVLDRALARCHRLAMTVCHAEKLSEKASLLTELGDYDGALAAARAALDREAHPHNDEYMEAALQTNLAWTLLEETATTGIVTRLEEAERELLAAAATMESLGEGALGALAMIHNNLARLALLRNKPQEALHWLNRVAALPEGSQTIELRTEEATLRIRVAVAQGDLAAARALAEGPTLDPTTLNALPPELALEVLRARAEIHALAGELDSAQMWYEVVHRRTLELLTGLGGAGAQRFIVDRLGAAQRLAKLHHHNRQPEAALRVARLVATAEPRLLAARREHARRRTEDPPQREAYLQHRDQAERILIDRWDLAQAERSALAAPVERQAALLVDELLGEGVAVDLTRLPTREPEPGEVLLLYLPVGHDQLLGFAIAAEQTTSAIIDRRELPPPAAVLGPETLEIWSGHLLGPLAPALRGAEVVRILPSFGIHTLPFHALTLDGRPLLAHAAVEYTLDLPPTADLRAQPKSAERALIIGDPLGDLGGARLEAELLAKLLAARGQALDLWIGPEATGPQLRHHLGAYSHLHFAGHSASGEAFGWMGRLDLYQGSALQIADILVGTGTSPPASVVLLSCESGRVEGDPRESRMALTTAFLLAGSRTVLASATSLPDIDAPTITEALYAGETADAAGSLELRQAYRQALLGPLATEVSPATWQSLRLWVR